MCAWSPRRTVIFAGWWEPNGSVTISTTASTVFPIAIPPLRERPEDIEALVHHFVHQFARRMNRDIDLIPNETLDALRRHPWPGNVRELENVIQRAVILSTGARLTLPPPIEPGPQSHLKEPETLKGVERAYIARVLEEANWVIGGPRGAAARLGLKRTTLLSLLKRLGLSRPRRSRTRCAEELQSAGAHA